MIGRRRPFLRKNLAHTESDPPAFKTPIFDLSNEPKMNIVRCP